MDRSSLDALYAMVVDDALATLAPRVQAGLAGLMIVAAGWAVARPRPLPVVGFLAAAFVFARANHAFEGPLLYSISAGHGLVLADLLPVALLCLIGGAAVLHRGRGRLRRAAVHGRRPVAGRSPGLGGR